MKQYTIYKTINKINGKYYLGKHETVDPNDSYYGSGKAIEEAINKYGKENFYKEILFIFQTPDAMNQKEIELVTKDIVNDPMSYNLGVGGEGGPHFKGRRHTEETKRKCATRNGISVRKTPKQIEKEKQTRYKKNNGQYFSPETIEKIRQKALGRRLKK